ncbi:MAG: DEAD/DEAH box helicase [Clostridium sp.]|uniref:DEAD/DEAH box helicase n=1 Tax=Clostridium sp. TaxID=1506 RepID=UPI0025BC8F17|nr:DEAD/DEAH box helicase [Clostridium sp.]MCE5220574.1 DEAD/DEAH box helicase [Clostridium sp.]
MKVSELEKIILDKTFKLNLNRGKEILKSGDLSKININKIEDNYNIYGNFKCKNKIQSCNSHLRIDIKNKRITFAKCECSIFLEFDSKNNIYLCEHLVAIGLGFANQIKKKLNQTSENKEVLRKDKNLLFNLSNISNFRSSEKINSDKFNLSNTKEKLELNISLKETFEDKGNYFDVSISIGINIMYPISNIQEFIISFNKSKQYYIRKGLIYNTNKYYFSKEDEEILEYLYEYILISKENKGNSIRIHKEILRRFLKILSVKKIKFIYNYQTYLCEIKNEDLPLSFTLKAVKEDYVLTTKKVFPIPLNHKMDVFFFDRKIYIPSFAQIKVYKLFYNMLKDDNKITFYSDISVHELSSLISHINVMSRNVSLDEVIIEKLADNIKIDFQFEKKEEKFYCNVTLSNNGKKLSYNEVLNSSNSIIKNSKKIRLIESELNKNRFFYKNGNFIFYGNDDDYYIFLKEKFKYLKKLGEIRISKDSNKSFKFYKGTISEVKLNEDEDNNFNFSFKLDEIDNKDLSNVIKAYKNKKRYIKLKDDVFVDLEDEELKEFIRIIDSLNIDVTEGKDEYKLESNKLYYLNNKLDNKQINLIDGKEKLQEALKKLNKNDFEIPKDLKGSLREYQIKGYNWFKSLSYLGLGGILSDEMGLGKTIQTITFLLSEKNRHSLIVTPTSLIYNWKQEFDKFAPSLRIGIVHGSKNERMKVLNNIYDYDIILTTYGTLKNDILEYKSIKFDYLIIDEGQNINNPESQNAKLIKKIESRSRFVLTGTPIENNLIELWSLFDFIMPGYLYTKQEFSSKFVKQQKKSIEDLKILISPYILRRIKKDVINEIPEKIETKFLVEMTESQKKIYKAFIKDIQNNIKNPKINKNNITIFSYLTKLRQICLDPSIIIDQYSGGSSKINIAKELILENIKEHKILLFSQFTSVLSRISHELKLHNVKYSYLDGSVSSKNRVKLVDEFNENKEIRVFLISLKAGGTGLNLSSADIVIHFDPWWNLSVEDQATDRAHRIGQKHAVEVIKLIAKDTIEEKILLLQEDKKELINDVITGELKDENIVNKLKSNEILNLFLD